MLKKWRMSWSDGNTVFLRAARDGNLQDVLEYLKGSTDINTSNPNGLNALHLASKEGHINIVTELLKRGANVEAATKKGNTALHISSLAGHEEIVKLLVDNGAKVNVQAQMGFTPLYMAAQEGHSEVVKFLLASGANQSLATADGFTPLAVALQQGHERVVSCLLEHDTKGRVRLPALHIAAKKDDIKSAALLLQNEQNNVDSQTKSGFTPLHIAAHYGNINVGSLLISKGADVNYKAKNNITPLHVSSRWGKDKMVTLLLDNKASIDEKTRDGLTPLHCAARSGHENVVDLLLERGGPFSSKTKNGLTPLHMAAQGDHMDCARLLLYHRAPVDDVTVDYLTPLHVASHCGNVKTAKLLLDRKCDPNTRALNGFTPLHIACKKNRIKVVELLLRFGANIEATTESGLTPLHVASFMGHMNIVIYLIQNNANPDFPTVRGETALHLAARANQTDIIRILLRNGATVDARAREQQTPLHIAARLGNVDNVTLLLQHGASPDAVTKDLYTPLHIASKEGHEEVASVLLDQGATHSLTTKKGFTPLHIASKYGNIKVARLLLQKDANPDVQGKNGLTPLHVATHYNHVSVALLLLDNKASPHSSAKNGYTPLHIAAKKNQMDIATTLLEFSANPDAESKNGFTPLHLASQEGHTDMVSLLLEHKAKVNSKAHNGLTPMHLAAQEDKVNIAEVLVKYGSNTDPQTKAGYTPLHTACHFGQINMVRFLLEQGASVSATTKLGYTPLHQAAQQGHVQVVNLLLKNKASPNAVTNNHQTALSIAQRLGYLSVVDTLSSVTEVTETVPASEDKYKVVSPETMQDTLLSDSEDEGGEDSISLERGESTSPLDTSYEKDILRHPVSEDQRRRITSEIGSAMRYPSYLERGPDYEAEMRYYSGDTLSPHGRDVSGRGDSVFGGDYSTLDRLSVGKSHDSSFVSQTDGKSRITEESSELEYGDDFDDAIKKDYMEAQMMSQSYSQYSSAPPDNRLLTGTSKMESSRFSSYSGSSFNASFDPDNVAIDRTPTYSGKLKWKSFLISFMVDARGGAMRGRRHSGVRIIIPPRKASMPTRVTCRLIKKDKLMHPLPLNEGEALAARILEMGPVATKFLGRIVIEIPHFASLRGKEREIKILRSDNGEKWEEHPILATDDAVNKALNESLEDLEHEDDLANKRITRILTDDFPRYFALVTRVREERQTVGEEGGVISSTVVPQVQAVFPEGALTKKIRVGLQAQPISPDLVAKLLGNRVAVSPIVTVEPRRRKFHKTITLTIPVPKAQQKGMINPHRDDLPTLRVLYSISEGTDVAIWDDLTEQTQLKLVNDCVSFTTRVSGRFWLMDCQNYSDATRMATELYREAVVVPYMARFVVFAKRTGEQEGKLRMFCMTDDKIDKTLEKQEHFVEVARSRDVEVLEGRQQFVEMAGNLIPITKSGDQLYVDFKAFRENRLPCTVRIRDLDQEPAARVAFMKEPKVARGEVPQTPICNLNISLPDMSTSSSMEMDGDAALELRKRSSLLKEYGIVIEDTVSRAQIKLTDVADTLKGDWVILAQQLDFTSGEINQIKNDYNTVNDQALAMLQLWAAKDKEQATGNALEKALTRINREDVVKKCMYNVETVEDEVEAAAARVAMDQSGFDTFTEEVGISRDSSMKRGMSLDVQYDEQDIIKESESVAEESGSDVGSVEERPAPQAREEDTEQGDDDDRIVMEVDSRRGVAKEEVKHESKEEDFIDLISQLDKYAEVKDRKQTKQQDTDDRQSIQEDELTQNRHDRDAAAFELFSKLEEVGQQSAPQQMATQSQEQAAPDSAAIEALTQSLSFGEPPKDEASQPEETVRPQVVTDDFQQDVASEQKVTPVTQGSEFTAPPPLDEDVVDDQFEFLEEEINKSNIETEQCMTGSLDTKIPALQSDIEIHESPDGSSSVDPPIIEPDMGKVVESLRQDLTREATPPEPTGRRSSSLSSSSFSSSSRSLSDHEAEEVREEGPIASEPKELRETSPREDKLTQGQDSVQMSQDNTAQYTGTEEPHLIPGDVASTEDGRTLSVTSEPKQAMESSVDAKIDETPALDVSPTADVSERVQESIPSEVSIQETSIDDVEDVKPVQETSIDDVEDVKPVQETSIDDDQDVKPVQETDIDDVEDVKPVQETSVEDDQDVKPVQETDIDVIGDVSTQEPASQVTATDDQYDSLTSTSSVEIEQPADSSKDSDLDDLLETNIGHLQPSEISGGIEVSEDLDKFQRDEEEDELSSSSSSSSHSDSSGEHNLQPALVGSEIREPLSDIVEHTDEADTRELKKDDEPVFTPGSDLYTASAEPEVQPGGVESFPDEQPEKLESKPDEKSYETTETDKHIMEQAKRTEKFGSRSGSSSRSSSSSHTTYSSGDEMSCPSDSEDGKAMGEGYVDREEQYEVREDRASLERVLSKESQHSVQDGGLKSETQVVEVVTTKQESSYEEFQPTTEDLEGGKVQSLVVEDVTTQEKSTIKACQPSIEDIDDERELMAESFVDRGEEYKKAGDRASMERMVTEADQIQVDGETKQQTHVTFEEVTKTEESTIEECQPPSEDVGDSTQGEFGEERGEMKDLPPVESGGPPVEVGLVDTEEKKEGSPLEWRYPGDSEDSDTIEEDWKELEESGFTKRKVKKVTYDPHQPTVIGESECYGEEDSEFRDSAYPDEDTGLAEDVEIDENELRITEDVSDEIGSSDMRDLELTAGPKATSEMAPMPMQVQNLASSQTRYISSSYENVYDAVPLDPEKNRLSMDASELEIGDRFDTKQPQSHLQSCELTSSYEQLYAKDGGKTQEDIGELPPPNADVDSSAFVERVETKVPNKVSSFVSGGMPSFTTHTCPIYITVEEGLDKLVCDTDPPSSPLLRPKDFKERSLSYELSLEPNPLDGRMRHNSSPDMTAFQNVCSTTTNRVDTKDEEHGDKVDDNLDESSSSSEDAQLDDFDENEEEIRDSSEDKTEETDVEEQFSPLPKHSPIHSPRPSPKHSPKPKLDLEFSLPNTAFSFTDTPPENVSPSLDNEEVSPLQRESLEVSNMAAITVGVSPSDFIHEHPCEEEYEEEYDDGGHHKSFFDNDFMKNIPSPFTYPTVTETVKQNVTEQTKETISSSYEKQTYSSNEQKTSVSSSSESYKSEGAISPADLEEKLRSFSLTEQEAEELEIARQSSSISQTETKHSTYSEIDEQVFHSEEHKEITHETRDIFERQTVEKVTQHLKEESVQKTWQEVPKDEESHEPSEGKSKEQETVEVTMVNQTQGQHLIPPPMDIPGDTSSETSSDGNNEVFDETSGQYVRLPWEVAHQYKRQFSDSLIEQEKKATFTSAQSIDLGTFYLRDRDEESQYDRVTCVDQSEESTPVHQPRTQRVRFALSLEEDTHYYQQENSMDDNEVTLTEIDQDQSPVQFEPHDNITDTHQKLVIASILETRRKDQENLKAKDMETMAYPEISHEAYSLNERTYLSQGISTFTDHTTKEEKRLSAISETSETMTSSYMTAQTSMETSIDRSMIDSSQFTEALTGEELFARDDVTTEMSLTPVKESKGIDTEVVSRASRLAQQEMLQEYDEGDRSHSPSRDMTAAYEPMAEMHEEENQSYSQSSLKFPMALPCVGKALADNEIYESSETGGDTTEEKLSPIEETPQDDFPEEQVDNDIKQNVEKRVTFQTDIHNLPSVSSDDLVKTSTSSSEMEPTILAASYDLDSGRVSRVVASYDMSPDSVEKQFLPVQSTTKAILSSPEDDVFEAAADEEASRNLLMVSDASGHRGRTLDKSSGSVESCPSPPAPTPKDMSTVHETRPDLEGAAIKLQDEAEKDEKLLQQTEKVEQEPLVTIQTPPEESDSAGVEAAAVTHVITDDSTDNGSPFEVMSPSELQGYDQYMDDMKTVEMMKSFESMTTSTSSFSELRTADFYAEFEQKQNMPVNYDLSPLEPTAPPMPEVKSESSFEHSSPVSSEPSEKGLGSPFDHVMSEFLPDLIQDSTVVGDLHEVTEKEQPVSLPNGPTEVEYNPEIDFDFTESVDHTLPESDQQQQEMVQSVESQPDLIQSMSSVSSAPSSAAAIESDFPEHTDQDSGFKIEETPEKPLEETSHDETEEAKQNEPKEAMYGSQSQVTESIMEEIALPPGDQLLSSDQTLYGLDMPSEETGAFSLSISQMEGSGRFDTEPESDSFVGLTSQIDDDASEQSESKNVAFYPEEQHDSGLSHTHYDASDDIGEQSSDDNLIGLELQMPPKEHKVEEKSYESRKEEIYHGKRALEMVDVTIVAKDEQLNKETNTASDEQASADFVSNSSMALDNAGFTMPDSIEFTGEVYLNEDYQHQQYLQEEFMEEDIYKPDEAFMQQSEELDEKDDENVLLDFNKDTSDQESSGRQSKDLELICGSKDIEDDPSDNFEYEVDLVDLDRPTTPTPVDTKQHMFQFDNDFPGEDEGEGKEEIAVTASEFVESVLTEAQAKVTTDDDDVELEESEELRNDEDKFIMTDDFEIKGDKNESDMQTEKEDEDKFVMTEDVETQEVKKTDLSENVAFRQEEFTQVSSSTVTMKQEEKTTVSSEVTSSVETKESYTVISSSSNVSTSTFSSSTRQLTRQISEDIPSITITQHLHAEEEEEEEKEYPADYQETPKDKEEVAEEFVPTQSSFSETIPSEHQKPVITTKCIPEEEEEDDLVIEEKLEKTAIGTAMAVQSERSDLVDAGKTCIPEEEDSMEEDGREEEIVIKSSSRPLTFTVPAHTDLTDSGRDTIVSEPDDLFHDSLDKEDESPAPQLHSPAIADMMSLETEINREDKGQHHDSDQDEDSLDGYEEAHEEGESASTLEQSTDTTKVTDHFLDETDSVTATVIPKPISALSRMVESLSSSPGKTEAGAESISDKQTEHQEIKYETFENFGTQASKPVEMKFDHFGAPASSVKVTHHEENQQMEIKFDHFKSEPLHHDDQREEDIGRSRSESECDSLTHDDNSSVDSFTTVVPANEEGHEDGDRMDDFASMTSSFHSDIMGMNLDDDIAKDLEGPLIDWGPEDVYGGKGQESEKTTPLVELSPESMLPSGDKDFKPPTTTPTAATSSPISIQTGRKVKAQDSEMVEWADKVRSKHDWEHRHSDLRYKGEKEEEDLDGPLIDWRHQEEDLSSSENDRYEFIDKNALSVITELSEEDRFEILEKTDLESETSDRHYSSPDMPMPSPGLGGFKLLSRSADRDDISVTSSLLEFEKLERQIGQSGSASSLEGKESLSSSMDDKQFMYNKSTERDDISVTSSLAEFERLEHDIGQSSSAGSVDKITPPDSKSSDITGSKSSLGGLERLEKDFQEDRRGSTDSFTRRSETSSLASLNDFERLEQEMAMAQELEAEAQKIVSILESGTLPQQSAPGAFITKHSPTTAAKTDMDQDSVDGREELEDSLSEDTKKRASKEEEIEAAEVDSLDGDLSELTSMTSSVIFAHKEPCDADSLHETDGVMKISSDSLGEQLGVKSKEFDTDSLQDQDGIMERSSDSLELNKSSDNKSDSLFIPDDIMQTSADSLHLPEDAMQTSITSVDSLHGVPDIMQTSIDSLGGLDDVMQTSTDSVPGRDDVMQTSADSLESMDMHYGGKDSGLECSMWSVNSSNFSRSSAETMRSVGSSRSESGNIDIMQVSNESWENKGKKYIMDNYHSYRTTGAGASPFIDYQNNLHSELTSFHIEDNYQFGSNMEDFEQEGKQKPFLAPGPYEEKKKIFTMAEWEAMKKKKKSPSSEEEEDEEKSPSEETKDNPNIEHSQPVPIQQSSKTTHHFSEQSSNFSSSSSVETIMSRSFLSQSPAQSGLTFTSHQATRSRSSASSSMETTTNRGLERREDMASATTASERVDPRRVASIDDDDFAEYDVTEHKELSLGIPERFVPVAQRSGPIYYEPGEEDQDSEEDEVLDFTTPKHLGHPEDTEPQGAEGSEEGSATLYMKKEIHTKTVMKDGQEQTFVTEESRVQQDNEPPEELRDSMRQIIDQFMEHGGEKEPTSQALEHDV